MPKIVKSNITVENAKIVFRNFSGKKGDYNPLGRRQFCVLLENDDAKSLSKDGWNIKWLEPRDPDEERQAYLPVEVGYSHWPPKITLIKPTYRSILQEDEVHILDWAEIEIADIIIRPYNWEVNKKTGIKAYLKTMYVTVAEDEFEAKYQNVPMVEDHENPPPWED